MANPLHWPFKPSASNRGQAVLLDFIVGLFVFMMVLAYFIIIWSLFTLAYANHVRQIDYELSSLGVADRLVSSGGSPANWTLAPATAQSIGLAQRPNELDWYRLRALSSLNYTVQKQELGIDKDFVIKVETPDGARLATVGQSPGNASQAVEATRMAMLNGTLVALRVQVYENGT